MSFVWKGKYTNEEQLKIGSLPENAVRFKEPKSMLTLNLVAALFIIPVETLIAIAIIIKTAIGTYTKTDTFSFIPLIFALLTIIPHELLHAICFPKEAEVQFWYNAKHGLAFVFSAHPVSKKRFIFISFLPNLVFGFLPLILWVVLPLNNTSSEFLLSFAHISLLFGCGDYLNIFNALTQMPKGTITQLYGFNSYWYYPNDKQPLGNEE